MKKFLAILIIALSFGCGNSDPTPNHRPSREAADQFLVQTGFVKVGFLGTVESSSGFWFDYSATSPSTPNILYRVSLIYSDHRNEWKVWDTRVIGNGNLVIGKE